MRLTDYFGARYYDSETGIWISVDPLLDNYPSFSPYVYCANNPVKFVDPDGRDWYEFHNKETGDKEIKWTDYKSQTEMDINGIEGNYLGEAFVHFQGSYDEKLGVNGKLDGEGANPAQVTIYGVNGEDDIKTYNGLTTPKNNNYSTLDEGDYQAYYQDMATSVYGTAGAKARGVTPALTYRIKSLNRTPLKGTKNGEKLTMEGVFFHRTDWDGTAKNSSMGCPTVDGRYWKIVEKQLGKSLNIRIRISR